jgi:hypothetical protein
MPNRDLLRRWVFSITTHVHPCLCGYTSDTYAPMKRHRRKCKEWQDRPDPRGLTISRRLASKLENAEARNYLPCPACGGRPDHHTNDCPHSQGELARRDALAKNGIDPVLFSVFLRLLARRFESH